MAQRPLKVLVLEDRPEDLELILRTLRKAGFTPNHKRVESEAEYRVALKEEWDVILSDYTLPQFNAPQALAVLQQMGLDAPFLVITGSISEDVAVACMKQGAADYLLKDRLVRLGAAVEQALQIRQAERERKATENALRLTQYAVDHSPVAVLRTDLQGHLIYVNDAACRLLGYPREELLKLAISDIDPNSKASQWPASATELRENGAAAFESTQRRKDGTTVAVEIAASYLEFAGEACLFFFITDISQRKQAAALLLESEKMRTVAGLAAGMAHEINNPLAGVMQNAQVVLTRIAPGNAANQAAAKETGITMEAVKAYMDRRGIPEMLEAVRESGQRAADIVRNMLSFSRTRETIGVPQQIDQLLDKTVDLALSDYDLKKNLDFRKINVTREYQPDLPPVICQPAEIQQVILNLLRNAAYALSERDNPTNPPAITLRARMNGSSVKIEVEDNGPGMSEEVRQRAFEPFFTTKPTGEGTGLGLYVSYFIITENHSGTMKVESAPGKGAKFVIGLPLKGK